MTAQDAKANERAAAILGSVRRIAASATGKILCHAEGEDGVMSALILFAKNGEVVLKFPDQALTDALFEDWNASARSGSPWAALTLTIAGGETRFERTPPAGYVAPEIEERIPRLAKGHFDADRWDDSDPEPAPLRKPWWRVW